MTDGRALRWAGHREQRRAQFVEAALAVIAREGPSATVDQVAAESGVSKQALYRQFDDRADLDRAIAQRAADDLLVAVLPPLALREGLAVGELARAALQAYLDHVQQHLSLYRFVRSHEASTADGVKQTVSSRVADLAAQVVAGQELAVDPVPFAVGVVGMADAVISRWLEDPAGLAQDDLVEQLVVMVTGVVTAVLAS